MPGESVNIKTKVSRLGCQSFSLPKCTVSSTSVGTRVCKHLAHLGSLLMAAYGGTFTQKALLKPAEPGYRGRRPRETTTEFRDHERRQHEFLHRGFDYVMLRETMALTALIFILRAKSVLGEIVLVTGAGGGIGRLIALKFAQRGATVVVWDIKKNGVKETVELISKYGGKAHGFTCDLTDRDEIYKTAEAVKKTIGNVTMLINNAGIVFGKTLLELPDNEINTTFQVNILAHYWTTKAFLKDMMDKNHGHIVTVASVAGLLGTYRCTDYSATKFAAVGFHESLFTELKTNGYTGIQLTLICPYYINTGMFNGVKPRLMPMLEPEEVAEQSVAAILANEINVTLPTCVRFFLPLKCFLPDKLCWALMYHVMQGPQSMMTFKGREH